MSLKDQTKYALIIKKKDAPSTTFARTYLKTEMALTYLEALLCESENIEWAAIKAMHINEQVTNHPYDLVRKPCNQ